MLSAAGPGSGTDATPPGEVEVETVASVGSPQCDRGFILDALLAMNEVPVCKLDKGDVFISLVDPRCISETMEVYNVSVKKF